MLQRTRRAGRMRSWCLCQICTCGRHRCPRGTTRIYENSGAFCPTTTEYLENYPTHGNVPPAQSLKPKPDARADRGRMEGITTFKSDYRPHEIVPQPRHLPEAYKPKSGDIDLGTTYKRDFYPHPAQPAAMARPLERQHVGKGKLDTVPTYKDDYRAWALQKRHLCKPEPAPLPTAAPFDAVSTFRAHYLPPGPAPAFAKAAGCKPLQAPVHHGSGPFLDETSYAAEFAPKKPEACPAGCYPAPPPGYVFQAADSRGHRFFRKVAPASSSRQAP